MKISLQSSSVPWYCEPWPWLLMLGPFVVIVAGVITIWLAVSSADGLVDDDYYKQGMAVNQRIHRDQEALKRGVEAAISFPPSGREVVVTVSEKADRGVSPVLFFRLSHPTVAGRDIALSLPLGPDGSYRAALEVPRQGRWLVSVEDGSAGWRLVGEWNPEKSSVLHLAPKNDVANKVVPKQGDR